MKVKRTHSTEHLPNKEIFHHERKRYEPQFQYLNSLSEKNNKRVPTKEEVKSLIGEINDFLESNNTSIKYVYHEKLETYYVKVIDTNTNELIREIPSEKLLDLHAYLKAKIGLIFDKKV